MNTWKSSFLILQLLLLVVAVISLENSSSNHNQEIPVLRKKRSIDLNALFYQLFGGFVGGPYTPYGQSYGYYGGNPLTNKFGAGLGGFGGRYRYGLSPGYYNSLYATRGYGFHAR